MSACYTHLPEVYTKLRNHHSLLFRKDLQSNPQALAWLGVLCDRVADGNLPESAVDLLALTKLTPLLKDGGGIRPIAGGECLRKLTARALVREHREALQDATTAMQPLG